MSGNLNVWIRWPCLLCLIGIPGITYPQHLGIVTDQVEWFLESDESAELAGSFLERSEENSRGLLSLNNATREELAESGLFSPYQIDAIVQYRNSYGPLLSIYELAALPGFRMPGLKELLPFLTLGEEPTLPEKDFRDLLFLAQTGINLPRSRGYQPTDSMGSSIPYKGGPLKAGIRINASFSPTFYLGVAFEKDPGESCFMNRVPQFTSGYILLKGTRYLKKMVLGNFRVHHGAGLVNGSGFLNSLGSFSLRPYPTLTPYASWRESGYERGAGLQLDLRVAQLMIWSSYRTMDLSLNSFPEISEGTNWTEYERATGLHRTAAEIQGSSLAFLSHHGMHLSHSFQQGNAGAMVGWRIDGLTRKGRDSLQLDPGPSLQWTGSLHGNWYGNRFELSGEVAVEQHHEIALLFGWGYRVSDFLRILLMLHHYSTEYRGMIPSSYGSGSKVRNEEGVATLWHFEAGRAFNAEFRMELFRYPGPRYLARIPTAGYRLGLSISNAGAATLQWRFRIYRKMWQTTPADGERPLPLITTSKVTRLDLKLNQSHDGTKQQSSHQLQWQSRMVLSWVQGQAIGEPAYAVVQGISFAPFASLRFTLQWTAFNVEEWDNRIYLYEPGLSYNFDFPVCYGKGDKIAAVFSCKTGRHLTLSGKVTRASYLDRASTGSGTEWRSGNKRWEVSVQFRMKL
jgi:hypothetical protein